MSQFKGYVSKIETFATADGPGVRTVVFLSGCTLRCVYCHNPDMWEDKAGQAYTVDELMDKLVRMKPYFKNGGGVSFCGGEPLFQSKFLLECLKACHAQGIHTVLDTAGVGQVSMFDEILRYTDLVILDIKGIDELDYEVMTQVRPSTTPQFIEALKRANTKVWLRHVIVPNMNDSIEHVIKLGNIIHKIPNVEKVELLGYHTLGQSKYSTIRISDPLEGVKALDKDVLRHLQDTLNQTLIDLSLTPQ
jgi:pyruvate formate lyase activating enzyme